MSLRFFRRVRIVPGLRVNLSRSGPSVSIGGRGAWYTLGPRGRRATLGAPGTGLFYTEHVPPASSPRGMWAFVMAVVAVAALLLVTNFAGLVP